MRLSVILVAAALTYPAAAADDSVQATVFGGGTHLSDHAGNHAVVGGGVGVRASRFLILGEFAYIPAPNLFVANSGFGLSADVSGQVIDFNGGFHIDLTKKSRIVPYIAAGVGAGHASVTATLHTLTSGGQVFSTNATAFEANGGFGVRLYAGKRWGIEPELKVIRY